MTAHGWPSPGPLQLPVEHLDDRVDDPTRQLLRVHPMPVGECVPDRLNQGLIFVMPLLQQVKQFPLRILVHGGNLPHDRPENAAKRAGRAILPPRAGDVRLTGFPYDL